MTDILVLQFEAEHRFWRNGLGGVCQRLHLRFGSWPSRQVAADLRAGLRGVVAVNRVCARRTGGVLLWYGTRRCEISPGSRYGGDPQAYSTFSALRRCPATRRRTMRARLVSF